LREEQRPVCIRNTKKGLVPSFIHSFDAALVHRIARLGEWEMAPLTANHDCFATTAAHAGWLHNSLLTEFRAIYKEDWLERIRAEIYCATGGVRMRRMRGIGQLAPEEIGSNPHLFS
jgi:DNA-directed RNA polymerase